MARQIDRLGVLKIKNLTEPGLYADGGGLYLRVSKGRNAGKRWVFVYRRPGDKKRCEIGLGGFAVVPLAEARDKAAAAKKLVADGHDPRAQKHVEAQIPTFGEMADQHIAAMSPQWRNPKHRAQWAMTLEVYAAPLRAKRVDEINTGDVLAVLQPLWSKIPETASRLRGRIEAVLDAAKARGHRSGENPAAWRGHLKLILPPRPKLTRGHHARMEIDMVPAFIGRLREREALAARCLEFLILTASRSNVARGARWNEFDSTASIWTVPAARMKPKREHRVPLPARAITILQEMEPMQTDKGLVFPGAKSGKALSDMALTMVLRRMQVTRVTVHGFRSSFRDWAGNRTNFPRELAEHSLSHAIGDKAEQAYRRDDALERRRPLMEAWAAFCEPKASSIVVPQLKETTS